jgi:prepilin-type N-terminal cleavage/methylation domain-containing protein
MGKGKKGFTLLETILVLFLVGLILGLSTVFFAGFLPSARLEATGRQITGVIRHARALARLNMEDRTVVVDLDRGTYGIEGLAQKSIPPGTRIRVIDAFAGEIASGSYDIAFHPGGGVRGGDIVLSSGKKTLRIEMDPITGAVLIAE